MSRKNNSLILLLLVLGGCRHNQEVNIPFIPGLGPYKIEIQQGNVVTKDMVDKLQPGMTRNQVRFVLGTPLLVDPFRTDRWDYIYTLNKKGERIDQRQLKVYFKDDKMVRYDGDAVVEAKPAAGAAGAAAAAKPVAKPELKPVETPLSIPVVKPEAVQAPVVAKPEPATPARAVDDAPVGSPQLRMAPTEGEPAKPEERVPPAPVAAQPPVPDSLEAPPLPRLVLPPEQPAEQPAPAKP
jgi:outer membrane protein assembly factor BamE